MELAVLAIVVVVGMIGLNVLTRRAERAAMPDNWESPPLDRDLAPTTLDRKLDVQQLVPKIALRPKMTDFFGEWLEGRVEGIRVALQSDGRVVDANIGDFDADQEQLTGCYLGAATANRPLPAEGESTRLDPFVKDPSIASRYYLLATGPGSYPELQLDEVREALRSLSPSILEVGFYEDGGMSLSGLAGDDWSKDIDQAVKAVRALMHAGNLAAT